MRKEYMLLGYVILGNSWMEDEYLRECYDRFEEWVKQDANNGQMIKWCATLKSSKFENNKVNKARYIEIFKFIFREVRILLKIAIY